MQELIDGTLWIMDVIRMLFELLMTMLEGLVSAFGILTTMITLTLNTIGTLPNWLAPFMTITITITIIYFIINRETGKSDK